MRTPEELDRLFSEQISSVYKRWTMFGTPMCIEATLWCFHRAWALVHRREDEFQSLYIGLYHEMKAPAGLWNRFREEQPDGSDTEAFSCILGHWASITKQLGVAVDIETAKPAI